MYCYYYTTSSWTLTQVADDMAALLTGASVASLSASCNKSLSYKTGSTIEPGWTLHDADTGQSVKGFVVSAPDVDNLTTKYVNIWTNGTVGLSLRVVEDWDATTNAATNAAYNNQTMSLGTVGVASPFHIFATPEYIFISNGTAGNNAVGCLEVLRDTPYLADATPKPLVHMSFYVTQFHGYNSFYLPRLRNPRTGATLTTSSAGLSPMSLTPRYLNTMTGLVTANTTYPTLASDGSPFHQAFPMFFGWQDGQNPNIVYHGRVAPNETGHGPTFFRADINGAQIGDVLSVDGADYVYTNPGYGLAFPLM